MIFDDVGSLLVSVTSIVMLLTRNSLLACVAGNDGVSEDVDEDAEFDVIFSIDLDLNSLSFLRRFIVFRIELKFGAVTLFVRLSSLPLRR